MKKLLSMAAAAMLSVSSLGVAYAADDPLTQNITFNGGYSPATCAISSGITPQIARAQASQFTQAAGPSSTVLVRLQGCSSASAQVTVTGVTQSANPGIFLPTATSTLGFAFFEGTTVSAASQIRNSAISAGQTISAAQELPYTVQYQFIPGTPLPTSSVSISVPVSVLFTFHD